MAFSSDFNATTAGKGSFASVKDRDTYHTLKREIQNVFLKNTTSYIRIESITLDSSNYVNTRVLSNLAMDRLISRVAARGFNSKIEVNAFGKVKSLLISLPELSADESGYISDGWDENFRASTVKENIRLSNFATYKELTAKIEQTLEKNPDLYIHEISLPYTNTDEVLPWIIEDLETLGFKTHQDYKDQLIITNPNSLSQQASDSSQEDDSTISPQEAVFSPAGAIESVKQSRMTWGTHQTPPCKKDL